MESTDPGALVDIDAPEVCTIESEASSSLEDDIRAGLLSKPRSMPPKYFYDERGSVLFDQICDTPEYYPTRTESQLLERHAPAIMQATAPRHVIELGSGASRKTRHLLRAWEAMSGGRTYWPLDVSEEMLVQTATELNQEFKTLRVAVIVADYGAGLDGLPAFESPSLFVFLGSTIGNFSHDDGVSFLREVATQMRREDALLIGMDRIKPTPVLNAAYNDAQGLTAAFNLNLLNVLNREAGADFKPQRFRHVAFFDEAAAQIEMYLESRVAQTVRIASLNETIDLTAGERILTEISRKFTPESINRLLSKAGFEVERRYEPANEYFSLVLARLRG